jgi:hypothetical protein
VVPMLHGFMAVSPAVQNAISWMLTLACSHVLDMVQSPRHPQGIRLISNDPAAQDLGALSSLESLLRAAWLPWKLEHDMLQAKSGPKSWRCIPSCDYPRV